MAPQEPIRKRPSGPQPAREIPDKLYFRIGEVAKLCEVPAYVLRFWEGEFPQLKPNKGGTGQRLYRRRDVEMALRIKSLLYDEGYTIPGARAAFKSELRTGKDPQTGAGAGDARTVDPKHLLALQKDLREIFALLSKPVSERQAVQAIRASRPKEQAAPAPMEFPKPKLMKPAMVPKEKASDLFSSLFDFDDLPPTA